MNIKKPKLFMLVGLPVSGKSEIALKLSKEHNAVVVSSNSIRVKLGDEIAQKRNVEVFSLLNKKVKKLLLGCNNVVIDATNINQWARKPILDFISGIYVEKIAYVIQDDVENCIERNTDRSINIPKDVFYRMNDRFEMPTIEEGFNKILTTRGELL